jgi:hypothetical protein
MSSFQDLQRWYHAQCDGAWEHNHGIVIETIDNPGWWVKIDLRDTLLENVPFPSVVVGNADEGGSWIFCEKRLVQWHGTGDSSRLEEIVNHFLTWARDRANWLDVPDESQIRELHDEQLWEHLGHSRGDEKCLVEGCDEFRVRHSKYCRAHHWKMVLLRPPPQK